jgi:hypothetical protein
MSADQVIDYTKQQWWDVLGPSSVDGIYQTVGMVEDYAKAEVIFYQ